MSDELTNIETLLNEYVDAAEDAFTISEPLAAIQPKTRRSDEALREDLSSLLEQHERVFQVNDGEIRYAPRSKFFRGAKFRVTPTAFEIENGALVPGHRFVPFANPNVFPSDFDLFASDTANPVEVTFLSCPLDEVAAIHTLLGVEEIIHHFIADNPENAKILATGEERSDTVTLSVFDLDEFYAETGFILGDAIVFTVEDWREGVFRFERESDAGADGFSPDEWTQLMEAALNSVIDEYGEYITIPEQLAQALFRADPRILEHPLVAIDEYQRDSDLISVKLFGDQSVLWRVEDDDSNDDEPPVPDDVMISRGETDSLDAILEQMGAAVKSVEMRAFMIDELFNGGENLDNVLERSIGARWLDFSDDAQEAVFRNFVEEMWEYELESYNRMIDENKGIIRGRVLELVENRLRWLRYLSEEDAGEANKLRSAMAPMAQCALVLSGMLEKLNEPGRDFNEEEMNAALDVVERAESTQHQLIDDFNAKFLSPS